MNKEAFTGRAQAYTEARPGYSNEAVEYIYSLAAPNAVFADIGAGTGKFTELIARYGNEIFAIEPNADMLEQLAITLAPFKNARIFDGTAEATKLPDKCIDVITNAQALRRFNIDAFRTECKRIGKPNSVIITIFNGGKYGVNWIHGRAWKPDPTEKRFIKRRITYTHSQLKPKINIKSLYFMQTP